jgi:hypothetical protein
MRAPTLGFGHVPEREAIDQWLFLAQHVGLPTRLLDWSESALVGLYFALREPVPVVWMLDPIALNRISAPTTSDDEFPLTRMGERNIGHMNVRGAWEQDAVGTAFPVAILPTNIHPRMSVQRSCFTIQGKNKIALAKMSLPPGVLRSYRIDPAVKESMRHDLRLLGIDRSTVFPDLDGLAEELADRF